MRVIAVIFLFCTPLLVSATVFINEIQILPMNERFIELYNSSNSDIDLTGWYIQRKTATGNSFSSLVTSTQLNGKTIKAQSYFLVSRNQVHNSDVVVDLTLTESNIVRIRDSKGTDIDQIELGRVDEGKSYQKTVSGVWFTGAPTPRSVNVEMTSVAPEEPSRGTSPTNTPANISSFPVEPQIIADAGVAMRTISVGAPITFTGRVFGLKKEPIENARLVWSFGDGTRADGASVAHTYFYPGDYIVVLDTASGYYSASDRVSVRVTTPLLALHTGGDGARSFIAIENSGTDEIDLSLWQVVSGEKTFTFPQNTILSAKKTLTLASEVSLLVTPAGSVAFINFPNGSRAEIQPSVAPPSIAVREIINPAVKIKSQVSTVSQAPRQQEASVLDALPDKQATLTTPNESGRLWPWYIGSAFLGALALIGLRLTRKEEQEKSGGPSADDFEIIEETEDDEPH